MTKTPRLGDVGLLFSFIVDPSFASPLPHSTPLKTLARAVFAMPCRNSWLLIANPRLSRPRPPKPSRVIILKALTSRGNPVCR